MDGRTQSSLMSNQLWVWLTGAIDFVLVLVGMWAVAGCGGARVLEVVTHFLTRLLPLLKLETGTGGTKTLESSVKLSTSWTSVVRLSEIEEGARGKVGWVLFVIWILDEGG